MPLPFWRRVGVARMVILVLLIASLATLVLVRRYGLLPPYALLAVAWFTMAICPRIVFARMRTQLADNDYLMCLSCAYSLKGLPEEHVCPECGTEYTAEQVRNAWQHWVTKLKLPADVIG